MPIYEYECTECHRVEEVVQKISDKPLDRCSHCSGKLKKIISQSTFHLKGGGWYADDYCKKSNSSSSSVKNKTKSSTVANSSKKPAKKKTADAPA